MSLITVQNSFESALVEPVRVFEEVATTRLFTKAADFTTDDLCVLEGALSRIWQVWCQFCRAVLVESCMGTVDLSGVAIPGLAGAQSEDHVSAAAIRAKQHRPIVWIQTNSLLWREPTWGDIDSLLDIVAALAPTNAAKLNGMCSVAGRGAKILQTARNAAAHDNIQTRTDLVMTGSSFSAFPITHACQALFWIEPSSQQYLLPLVLDELISASRFLIV